MNPTEFERHLAESGFGTTTAGQYEPGQFNAAHSHPFEVRGLILRGEMTITPVGSTGQRYQAGDIFTMPLAASHTEEVGVDGVDYLWAKRET